MLFTSFANDDIFISYARLDASTYAAGLADELTKRGFSCYIDRLGAEPGKDLPDSLRRKIRGSAMLVIIGTERASTRQTIEDEIKEFLGTGRRSSVIPIDFDGAVYQARWYDLIEGVAPEPEKHLNALSDGAPSLSVISRIEKQFNYTRRDQRLRRITTATAALLALLLLAGFAAGVYAKQQLESAREAWKLAAEARAEARDSSLGAERARAEALAAQGEAGRAKSAAAEQQRRTAVATKEAQKQTRLAAVASSRALEAAANLRRQESIAVARKAATNADNHRAQSVRREKGWVDSLASSTLLSIEAAKRLSRLGFPPADSDQSLRASLNLLPRSVRSFERTVEDVLLSTDGKYFMTKEDDFVRVWDTLSLRQISNDIQLENGEVTFNQDRTLMALIGKDNRVSLWELPMGKPCWIMGQVDEFSPTILNEIPLRFSPDGKYIAASVTTHTTDSNAESVHRVIVWNAKTGERFTEVEYEAELHGLAVNPSNDLLALSLGAPRQQGLDMGENNSIVQFWAIKNQTTLLYKTKKIDSDGPLHALSFSPNGRLLAAAGNNRASILEVGGGNEFTPIEGIQVNFDDSQYIHKLSFSHDGRSVGAMREGIDVDTWDVLFGRKLWRGYYSNEGWSYEKPYVVILESGGLRVLDVTTGADVARLFRDDLPAYGADYAPAADLVAVRFDSRVLFYDIGSAQEAARSTHTPKGSAKIVYRSPDQRYVILTDDHLMILWDAFSARKVAQMEHGGGIDALTFSPDGTLLAFLSADDNLRILETSTGREVWRIIGIRHPNVNRYGDRLQYYLTLGFSPRSGFLVLRTSGDGKVATVRVYSLSKHREVINLGFDSRFNDLYAKDFSFTLDEKFVLLREVSTERIYDTGNGEPVATVPKVQGASMVVLGPDDKHMARSLHDTIEVLEISSGRVAYKVHLAGGVSEFAFSPDGKLLAAVGGSGGCIWNAAAGGRIASLTVDSQVNLIQIRPDEKILVLFGRNIHQSPPALLGVWNIAKGRNVVPPLGGSRVIFSPDGRHAVETQPYTSSVQLLDLVAGRVVADLIHDGLAMDSVAFSADGVYLATASEDGVAHVWETDSGREIARLPHESSIISLAFELDGRKLTTVSDDLIARLWILSEDELIKRACGRLQQNLSPEKWQQNFRGEKYSVTCPHLQTVLDSPQTDSP